MTTAGLGLRELKKQMTRQSIADAALQLTREKGFDAVTVEEIARLAIVSPRTVSNYFPSKEEAVLAAGAINWLDVLEDFAEGPPTERPLEELCTLLSEFAKSRTQEQLNLVEQTIELLDTYPALKSVQSAANIRLEDTLRDHVAARTGTDPATQMYPWLVATSATSAIRSALRLWSNSGAAPERLPVLIEDAFKQISAGLPVRLADEAS